jgi:hypothetical protein
MRALLLIVAVLFAVRAEATPDGCFVTFNNPGSCHSGEVDVYYGTDNENLFHYGVTVGSLVNDLKFTFGEYNKCTNDFSACTSAYTTKSNQMNACVATLTICGNDYNECAADYNNLLSYSQSQDVTTRKLNKLIKTLKRKCGTRCR